MGKLNENELLNCIGGNIITTITSLFVSFINVSKKLKVLFGGLK